MFIWVTDLHADKRVTINPLFIKKITEGIGGTFIEFIGDTDDTRYFVVKESAIDVIVQTEDTIKELALEVVNHINGVEDES